VKLPHLPTIVWAVVAIVAVLFVYHLTLGKRG